jgi:hypothetical protein
MVWRNQPVDGIAQLRGRSVRILFRWGEQRGGGTAAGDALSSSSSTTITCTPCTAVPCGHCITGCPLDRSPCTGGAEPPGVKGTRNDCPCNANNKPCPDDWSKNRTMCPPAPPPPPPPPDWPQPPEVSSLFSFWVATTKCGASRGYVAGGGPGIGGDVDSKGGCV